MRPIYSEEDTSILDKEDSAMKTQNSKNLVNDALKT